MVRYPELAARVGITCYLGGREIECWIFCPPVPDGRPWMVAVATSPFQTTSAKGRVIWRLGWMMMFRELTLTVSLVMAG